MSPVLLAVLIGCGIGVGPKRDNCKLELLACITKTSVTGGREFASTHCVTNQIRKRIESRKEKK